jgi:hypothetical protein
VPYIFPHPGLLDGRKAAARGNGLVLMYELAEAVMRRCVVTAENDPLVEFAESQRLRGRARCYADEQ